MAGIDDKVVSMSFENSKFEAGVSKTLGTIGRLKEALKFGNAGKELFAEKIEGRGRRRQKAEDMFY